MSLQLFRPACAALLACLAAATQATAGTFSISPVRVELSSAQKTAVLTVRNEDDAPVLVQVQTLAWSQAQDGGADAYAVTRDLLATPPVFTLAPKSQQILRVALRRPVDAGREVPYRIVLQEVAAQAPADFTGLRVALRLSLPVFVQPPAAAKPQLRWQAQWQQDGSLQLVANNQGAAHIQLLGFNVQLGTDSTSQDQLQNATAKYLLGGSSARWDFKPAAGVERAQTLIIEGNSDQGPFSEQLVTGTL